MTIERLELVTLVWRKMYFAAQDAAWMRLENQGFDPSKFGIEG